MGYKTVKFLGKEYSIPEDMLTYIDLLDFTDSIQKQLASTFVRKLRNEIVKDNIGLLGDEDLAQEIEQQVGKYISKLCDNGIFTRTINDYLKDNKGYELYSKVNKAALDKIKSLLIREMDDWKAGYENAVNNAESHVTGMGFSIWSGSFVNHAIYAAMEASTLNKQSKEAESQYHKDMGDLRSRLDSKYGGEKSNYINNTYIPNMEAALTVFAYELLDKYVADLIANGKFDGKTLDYVDISRSNDLLKNLTLSNNKQAILENAFAACPYNIAVYMQAMKYDLLDYDSFQTAKVFKQDHHVLSFFRDSWGEVSFPTKFNINYHCINVWASLTDKSSADLLRGLTEQYATGIVKAYSKVAEMLTNNQLCRKVIGDCSEDAILAGDAICKTKAHSYVDTIVSSPIWNQLTEKCGHPDLLDRIKKVFPSSIDVLSKEEYDKYLVEQLFSVFATERGVIAAEIEKLRKAEVAKKAELEKQDQERRKRNKKIAAIAISVIMVVVAFVIVLNSIIIPSVKYDAAIKLMNDGKYEDAIAAFEDMDGYKESFEKIEECQIAILDVKYGSAITLMINGQYNEAISAFEELQGHMDSETKIEECRIAIKDIQYTEAVALMNNGKYKEAMSEFKKNCNYKDSYIHIKNLINRSNAPEVIRAGSHHTVALKSDGTVMAVGYNIDGQCDVDDWSDVVAVSASGNSTVGLKSDGTVVAVGQHYYGQCDIDDWSDIVAVSAGGFHTVGLKSDGTVVAVGYNSDDQCDIDDWSDIVAVSAGDFHTIGLKSDGTVVATGDNSDGQCDINGWSDIVAVSAGGYHTVGLKFDGTVVATGDNSDGQCYVEDWPKFEITFK